MIDNAKYRAIWVSLNKNLESDARNELEIVRNIGNECPQWLKLKDLKNGKDGIYFTTYGSMIREETYETVLKWLQESNNVTIIFDEAHSAKNSNSKCGKMVVKLRKKKSIIRKWCIIPQLRLVIFDKSLYDEIGVMVRRT